MNRNKDDNRQKGFPIIKQPFSSPLAKRNRFSWSFLSMPVGGCGLEASAGLYLEYNGSNKETHLIP